jgi:hypothetical protein
MARSSSPETVRRATSGPDPRAAPGRFWATLAGNQLGAMT